MVKYEEALLQAPTARRAPRCRIAAGAGAALLLGLPGVLPAAAGITAAAAPSASAAPQAATSYPERAPLEAYLPPSAAAEIALARSAAPAVISAGARVLAFGRGGYVTAVPGTNRFVCLVERSWANHFDSPDFWNPHVRAPHCFNAAAARTVLPSYLTRTAWVLEGASREQMRARTQEALAAHAIPAPASGSIAYMMSREGYLGDDVHGAWHPHLMFYLPRMPPEAWGANLAGSPVVGDASALEPLTIFIVPVTHWSDGAPAAAPSH
jgi:hypothetical protein